MADYKRAISPDMHLAYHRQGVGKEMARCSHTPACCVSKHRSSIEAGKKQPIVWLQHVCGVTEMFLYSSLGVPFVFLWYSYRDTEMTRNGFEDDSKGNSSDNTYTIANEVGLMTSRTNVRRTMKICSFVKVTSAICKIRV